MADRDAFPAIFDRLRGILSQQLGIDGGMIDIAYPVDLPGYSGSAGAH